MKKIVAWVVLTLIVMSIFAVYMQGLILKGASFAGALLFVICYAAFITAVVAVIVWCVNVLVD
jgi:hypothetical protein